MNARERYVNTLLFKRCDLVPLNPGWGRRSTRNRWHNEGLPKDVPPEKVPEYAYRVAGGKLDWPEAGPHFGVNERMIPQFEEKIVEVKENSQVVQDWKGNICEIGLEFDLETLRNAVDFVTRRWIKCPVESETDWAEMKTRYNPDDPKRLPENAAALGAKLKNRTWPITFGISGPFWQMREWLGFENLCTDFYDNPKMIRDMVEFWTDYHVRLLSNAFNHLIPDEVHISEDMAYKCFSMISPAMVREYLLPCYKRWGKLFREAGVPLYGCDSDGFIGELIPIWIEAGINCCDPIEVAAGNDIVDFRRRFGTTMAYNGGIDKRLIAKGGKAIEDEIARITPVIKGGGYIPGCDHGVPHDVSWDNYVYYVKLLSKTIGWM